jgi:potassium efflux system protein
MFFWAADINTWLGLKSRVLADIYTTFAKEGIDIPFPTRDLFLHYDEKPTAEADKDEPMPGNPSPATDSNKPEEGLDDVKH